MVKLSKAQEKVLNRAKEEIDIARKYNSYEEYYLSTSHYKTIEECKESNMENWNYFKEKWELRRSGIVTTMCNTKTIEKLESFGLIKIIYNSNNCKVGIDTVKVLNY